MLRVIIRQCKMILLVGLVVIGAELGREDHGSTPQLRSEGIWNHLMLQRTHEPD
jgi:hypothetical protein